MNKPTAFVSIEDSIAAVAAYAKDNPSKAGTIAATILTTAYAFVAPEDVIERDEDENDDSDEGDDSAAIDPPVNDEPPRNTFILSVDGFVVTNAPMRPQEADGLKERLAELMRVPHALLVGRHALARVQTEQAIARTSDAPDAAVNDAIVVLLEMARDQLGDIVDGSTDIILDTPEEVKAATLLELRGKGRVIRTDTTPTIEVRGKTRLRATEFDVLNGKASQLHEEFGEPVENGTVSVEHAPGAPITHETLWRVTRADMG